MEQTHELSEQRSNRLKRIGLYLLGIALIVVGVGAFGLVAFAAAWDNAWGTTSGREEIVPFFLIGATSWIGAVVAIGRGRQIPTKAPTSQDS